MPESQSLTIDDLRAEFADYLVNNTATRWGLDAALMHVCRIAYERGLADGAEMADRQRLIGFCPKDLSKTG